MKKSIVFFSLMGILNFSSYSATYDYIDLKNVCNSILSKKTSYQVEELSTCHHSQESLHNKNLSYDLTVDRVDTETGSLIQNVVSMNESDVAQVCEQFENNDEDIELKALAFDIDLDTDPKNKDKKKKEKKKWKLIFTFGPFLAFHHKMNLKIQNDETNATIKGIQPKQRHGLHHYALFGDGTGPGKFIDEPQNRITVELVNDKMFIGLEYNHPKILFQDEFATPDNNQNVDISGTIAGKPINAYGVPLSDTIYQIQASHGNTNINAFAGKIFKLAGKTEGNNLEVHLGGGAGISFANGVTKYFYEDENGERRLNITENEGMKVYGFNLNGKARIRHNFLKGRMNASLTYDGVYTRFDGPLGGFDVEGNLYSHHIGLAVGVRLDDLFKKKRNKRK